MALLRYLLIGCAGVIATVIAGACAIAAQLPAFGAGALLHPSRHTVNRPAPPGCVDTTLTGEGVALSAWRCSPSTPRKATIVYLHGVADNRGSAAGVVARFAPRGFEVVAYDSRAHGGSGGAHCTYGFFEKADLRRVIDGLDTTNVVLIGHSLGAAVALQAAAQDSRVRAVIAASTFSDLRTIATERALSYFSSSAITKALQRAELDAGFNVGEVSPVVAAGRITVPTLVIHGEDDRDTAPAHSQRVFNELAGPGRLLIVPAAGHNDVLRPEVWQQIEAWIDQIVR